MTVIRMDNVSIVVEDLDAATAFFIELGLIFEGRAPVEGDWAGRVTGVHDQRVEIAMLRTPDGSEPGTKPSIGSLLMKATISAWRAKAAAS